MMSFQKQLLTILLLAAAIYPGSSRKLLALTLNAQETTTVGNGSGASCT